MLLSSHMLFQFTLKLYKERRRNEWQRNIRIKRKDLFFWQFNNYLWNCVFFFVTCTTSLDGYISAITIGDFLYTYIYSYMYIWLYIFNRCRQCVKSAHIFLVVCCYCQQQYTMGIQYIMLDNILEFFNFIRESNSKWYFFHIVLYFCVFLDMFWEGSEYSLLLCAISNTLISVIYFRLGVCPSYLLVYYFLYLLPLPLPPLSLSLCPSAYNIIWSCQMDEKRSESKKRKQPRAQAQHYVHNVQRKDEK